MKYIVPALLSGVLLAVSWPTYGVPFFIFFALVPLLLLEHDIAKFSSLKNKGWAIFALSYLSFFIWNIVATGWLYGSRNPDGSHAVAAVALPVFFNSLFYALLFQCYHWYKNAQGTYWGLTFFVAAWMSFEKLHLSWELSWPWLNLGNAFSEYPKIIQWYDTLGATGGSLWILLVNVFGFYAVRTWEAGRKRNPLIKNGMIILLAIILPIIISLLKYRSWDERPTGTVNVVLLQPELDPYNEKYTKDSTTILRDLLDLAGKNSAGNPDYFIVPETALPGTGSISETGFAKSALLDSIRVFLARHPHAVFETGISSHRFFNDLDSAPPEAYALQDGRSVVGYNSAIQILPDGKTEVYHKAKLVPGVEIFPYMKVLRPLLGNAMLNFGGTVASLGADNDRKVFRNPYNKAKAAPIICYESIYGEFVAEYVKNGANFLTIMTNDSWWGVSEGHRQLLSYARLRAIETRREIARSANSGVSAHINTLGEVEEDTLYGDKTALPATVKLYEGQSFYVRAGDLLSRLSMFVLGFLVFYTLIKKIQARKEKSGTLPHVGSQKKPGFDFKRVRK